MDFVEIVLNFKRHLEVFELLRNEPTANEVGDDQRKQQWSHGVEGDLAAGRDGSGRCIGKGGQGKQTAQSNTK